jgi:hypothetical protein
MAPRRRSDAPWCDEYPVGRRGLRRIGQRGERQFAGAGWRVEREPRYRPAHAGDDIMPAGGGEAAGGDAADRAEADHGDGQPLRWRRSRHSLMVGQVVGKVK